MMWDWTQVITGIWERQRDDYATCAQNTTDCTWCAPIRSVLPASSSGTPRELYLPHVQALNLLVDSHGLSGSGMRKIPAELEGVFAEAFDHVMGVLEDRGDLRGAWEDPEDPEGVSASPERGGTRMTLTQTEMSSTSTRTRWYPCWYGEEIQSSQGSLWPRRSPWAHHRPFYQIQMVTDHFAYEDPMYGPCASKRLTSLTGASS